MTKTLSAPAILNIAAYKFVPLDDLASRRAQLKQLCVQSGLRGTIMLSPEGINMFVAGDEPAVRELLSHLRQDPLLSDIAVKESYSDLQPFNRMLVKLKREIIAFGVETVNPLQHTSPKLTAKELLSWFEEGKKFRLLDVRNTYEFDLGTFDGAEQLKINHFRNFPQAITQLPESAKREPLVMFCTGGIRCEKAGPMMEQAGFEQVYQLEGGILKYFEECGGKHYHGNCFVFDNRVALDAQLKPTGDLLCFACQAVVTHEDIASDKFLLGKYCPNCFRTPAEEKAKQMADRQLRIDHCAEPLPGSVPYENVRMIHVPQRYAGLSMIDFLDAWHPPTGRQQWLDWIEQGTIAAEGVPIEAERIVREGESFAQRMSETVEPPVNANIQLLHEDEFLVIINKPAPLPVHPSGRFNRNTLSYIVGEAYRPEKLRVAHRLDANTTGVVVLCRKYAASKHVQPQFSQQTVDKVYLACVHGHPDWDNMRCEASISSDPAAPSGARQVDPEGLAAVTDFRVIERLSDGTSLLEARPRTGRTNQIRIHLWHLEHTIVGDPLYLAEGKLGDSQTLKPIDAQMMLHAWRISFNHPETNQRVTYEASPPDYFGRSELS